MAIYSRVWNKHSGTLINSGATSLLKGATFVDFWFFQNFSIPFNFLLLCLWIKDSNHLLFERRLHLFKGICLLFLQYVPGATFIQGVTFIPDSWVQGQHCLQTLKRCKSWIKEQYYWNCCTGFWTTDQAATDQMTAPFIKLPWVQPSSLLLTRGTIPPIFGQFKYVLQALKGAICIFFSHEF